MSHYFTLRGSYHRESGVAIILPYYIDGIRFTHRPELLWLARESHSEAAIKKAPDHAANGARK